MAILLGLLSACGYALQNTLLARHIRELDLISIFAYRGLALSLSMLPLLLLSTHLSVTSIVAALPLMGVATVLAMAANCANGVIYRTLPIGVANAVGLGAFVVLSAVLGWLCLGELLSPRAVVWCAAILAGSCGLSLLRGTTGIAGGSSFVVPLGAASIFAVLMALAFVILTIVSRTTDPYFAAWEFESGIGCAGVCAGVIRRLAGGKMLEPISRARLRGIFFASAPTIIGTGCFAAATTYGALAVAAATGSVQGVVSTLLAAKLYHEHISLRQALLVLFVAASVVGLKLVS